MTCSKSHELGKARLPGEPQGLKVPPVLMFVNLCLAGDGKGSLCQVTGAQELKLSPPLSDSWRIGTCCLRSDTGSFLGKASPS